MDQKDSSRKKIGIDGSFGMSHSFLDNAKLEPSKVKALGNLPYFGYSTVDYF